MPKRLKGGLKNFPRVKKWVKGEYIKETFIEVK
jgi:hypothetical protein